MKDEKGLIEKIMLKKDFSKLPFMQHFGEPALQPCIDLAQHPFAFTPSSLFKISVFVVCFSVVTELCADAAKMPQTKMSENNMVSFFISGCF